jgi:HEAT repeat protein
MIEALLERLHTPDPSDKRNALESLYEYCCDDRVLEAAAFLLTDPDRGVRESASHVLVRCANEKAASLTAVHISSSNIAVRNLAGDALVRMGASAIGALIPYVDSRDKDVRKFAVDLIAQLPTNPSAILKISERLHDIDPNVVCAAIDALGSLHATQYLHRILGLFAEKEFARPNIVNTASMFPEATDLPFLVQALSDEDPVVQLSAAEALSTRKDENLLPVLLPWISRVSDLAKPVILHSIVVLMDSAGFSGEIPAHLRSDLLAMLDDSDPVYVRAAVRGLGHFVDNEVLSALISHAGRNESIDSAILSLLKSYPKRAIQLAVTLAKKKGEPFGPANMVVSLMQILLENEADPAKAEILGEAGTFVAHNFSHLEADTKIIALSICGELAMPISVKLIKCGLEDPESAVKSLALDLVAKTGPQYFEPELKMLRTDFDEEVRFAATALITQQKPGFRSQD